MTQTHTAPRHPDLRHLTPLGYYLIGGGQPTGQTRIVRLNTGMSMMEQASNIVMKALEQAKARAALAPAVGTLSQ